MAIRSVPDVAAVHTASHFSVRQEAFDYIDAEFTRLTITSSKVNCMDSSRKNHSEVEQWISYGRISLKDSFLFMEAFNQPYYKTRFLLHLTM